MNLDAFISKFNGLTEPYYFYNHTIELQYESKGHVYYRIMDGEFVPQDGVTNVCHIIDKSNALIPWACKQMATKLLSTTPVMTLPTGDKLVPQQPYAEYEKLVLAAKSAHKETLEDAGDVGTKAHAWIERYIKQVLASDDGRRMATGFAYTPIAPEEPFPEEERTANCCKAALDWMGKHQVVWVCTERKIYSRLYEYAGTMDGLAYVTSCNDPLCCPNLFARRLSVVDWKSSNYLYMEFALQTAAYQQADEEELHRGIQDRWIIRLGKEDGEFDPWHFEADAFLADFSAFLHALALVRSTKSVEKRLKDRAEVVRQERKARAKQAKDEALKVKCKGADKYKGVKPPRCNGGHPCQTCIAKYQQRHPDQSPTAATSADSALAAGLRRIWPELSDALNDPAMKEVLEKDGLTVNWNAVNQLKLELGITLAVAPDDRVRFSSLDTGTLGTAVCTRPPEGWWCSREPERDGPCAARPLTTFSGLSLNEMLQ